MATVRAWYSVGQYTAPMLRLSCATGTRKRFRAGLSGIGSDCPRRTAPAERHPRTAHPLSPTPPSQRLGMTRRPLLTPVRHCFQYLLKARIIANVGQKRIAAQPAFALIAGARRPFHPFQGLGNVT